MIARNRATEFYRQAKPTEELPEDLRGKNDSQRGSAGDFNGDSRFARRLPGNFDFAAGRRNDRTGNRRTDAA